MDAEVMHRVFQVELVAALAAREAALHLRQRLFDLRDVVRDAAWHDDAYMQALHAYQAARAQYIEAARAEVLRDLE